MYWIGSAHCPVLDTRNQTTLFFNIYYLLLAITFRFSMMFPDQLLQIEKSDFYRARSEVMKPYLAMAHRFRSLAGEVSLFNKSIPDELKRPSWLSRGKGFLCPVRWWFRPRSIRIPQDKGRSCLVVTQFYHFE